MKGYKSTHNQIGKISAHGGHIQHTAHR